MIRTKQAVTAEKKTARKPKSKAHKAKAKKPARKGAKPAAPKPEPEATAEAPAPKAKPGRPAGSERVGGPTPKLQLVGVAKVIEVLRASGGIKAVAADHLNVSRTTLYKFIDEHPEVEEALVEIDGEIGDIAEAKVVTAIKAGDMQTVRWYLEMKGKERGYVRRVENTGKNGGPIETREKMDLSGLSDEELEILKKAATRRESEAVAR